MLNPETVDLIRQERDRYEESRAAIVGALRIVQERHGWVSDEHVRDIGEALGQTAEEVESIATFYSLIYREPVGRHVILLCDSVSCWIMGYNPLREHLAQSLGLQMGQTTADGRFTLLPVACLGACDQAPAMMVDRDLHVLLTPEKIDAVLASYQ